MSRYFLFVLCLVALPVGATEECYLAESPAGGVTFHVLQAGAPYTGEFKRFSGEICLDAGRITRIDAMLDPASVDTGLPELDEGLKGSDFFAVAQYPRVTFGSQSVQSQGNVHKVHGILEIKGIRREVDVVLNSKTVNGKTALSGALTLDRLQYRIGMGEWTNTKWLGAQVQLDINAVLGRKK